VYAHPGIEEAPDANVRAAKSGPTVVKGALVLGAVGSRQNTEYRADLLDINGRKVMNVKPGANDVSRLAPGVYFAHSGPSAVSRQPSANIKVVVTR
jgi:hypothetical protein